ncbi:carboxypeptidase [Rhynchospora pubera]|uniref:Carboxypeptidase n=1 Tax=Rhynchospora pubera TaxID=906938 RepID=A0AAV8C3B8_9POAL|nr:carboxypeptidase [Rhynchospora pubera]
MERLASFSLPLPIPSHTHRAIIAVSLPHHLRLGLSAVVVRCHRDREHTHSQSHLLLRTCKNCKSQFDPALNHPSACSFHTAHFGGETKRKFESVYTGGTMSTPDSGKVYQYWHCCGSDDPFHPGCTSAPHASYDQ